MSKAVKVITQKAVASSRDLCFTDTLGEAAASETDQGPEASADAVEMFTSNCSVIYQK